MRAYSYIFAGLILFLVFGAIGSIVMGVKNTPTPLASLPQTDLVPTLPTTPPPPVEEPTTETASPMITVSTPLPNTKVTSPLHLTGSARGMWYFEASFPIRLVDANGNIIAQTHAEAQGEWMTENFVPFTSTLTWATSTGGAGTIIFMRDNPSGLPENDAQIEIPVTL
jgi:hypothetical protein